MRNASDSVQSVAEHDQMKVISPYNTLCRLLTPKVCLLDLGKLNFEGLVNPAS